MFLCVLKETRGLIRVHVQVRIQETQAELPRGSIPRSLEIVLRAEAVETAQAGDRCDFTGTLIVVPDVSQLRTPGMFLRMKPSAERYVYCVFHKCPLSVVQACEQRPAPAWLEDHRALNLRAFGG